MIIFTFLGEALALISLNAMLTRTLKRAGESELKTLLDSNKKGDRQRLKATV
jgi:hypothetical protein